MTPPSRLVGRPPVLRSSLPTARSSAVGRAEHPAHRVQQKERRDVWLAGHSCVSHEADSNLNLSPEMPRGVLECDVVRSQNYLLMVL